MAAQYAVNDKRLNEVRKDLAGQSVKVGNYTVTYNQSGQPSRKVKDGGASATSTIKTKHANDSADHRAAYDAAAAGNWDLAGQYINNIIMQSPSGVDEGGGTVYNAKAGKDYFAELKDEFKYNANDYYRGKYDSVYGEGAWDGGTGTGKPVFNEYSQYLVDQYNKTGVPAGTVNLQQNGVKGTTGVQNSVTGGMQIGGNSMNPYGAYGSFDEFLSEMGYGDYADATQKAIQAAVQQAINGYNQQIKTTNEDSEELARQAYINMMMGGKNLDQQLAAGGYAGGMADSQRIALQANYENDLNALERQRVATINELQRAITNAQLTGDMQTAQELANYLQQVQGQWNNYVMNQQQMANDNYWRQQSIDADARNAARNWALTLIEGGSMPDTETLAAAGINAQEAQALLNSIKAQNAPQYAETPKVKYTADQAETALTALINGANDATARSIVEGYYGMPVETVLQAYGTPTINNRITLDQLDENQITNGKTANGVMLARTGKSPVFVSWAELGDMMNSGAAYAKEAGNGKYTLAYNG